MRIMIGSMTLLLLLSACSSKTDDLHMDRLKKNKTAYKHLQKTQKAQLYDGNTTKAFVTATYLYPPSKRRSGEENDEAFIVGVYSDEDPLNQIGKAYHLTLEGEKPKGILSLPKESPSLNEMPFVTEWSSYYLVTFPHTTRKSFSLVFEHINYGKKEMLFSKVAKYTESKKAF